MAISSKILIVEDAESDRVLLREILSDYVNIHETTNGMEALTFLQRNPDTKLVLLDIYMPHMDGLEMLVCMRLSPWLTHVPVIILSAADDEDIRLKAHKMGATEFITKPYVPEVLRQRTSCILSAVPHRKECRPGSFAHQMYDLSQSVRCGISVYEVTANGTVHMLFFNQSYADLCGYSRDEFTTMMQNDTLLSLTIYPEDHIIFRQTIETLLTEQQPAYQTLRIQRKDGTVRYIAISAKICGKFQNSTIVHVVSLDLSNADSRSQSILHRALGNQAFDHLTNIYTQDTFIAQTHQMLLEHPDEEYVLIVMNIDRFKIINDLFGIRVGDNILIQTAAYLRKRLLGIGTFGRLHGDSFVFCLPHHFFDIDQMLKTQAVLCNSFGINYNLTMHSGIYIIIEPQLTIDQMCIRAKMALATVKDNYNMPYAYYTERMHKAMLIEHQILNDMHQALERNEFIIYLQPIYSLHFHKPVSAEVLVRWQHPVLGLLSPGQFIPIFERNHFVAELDHYVWDLACQYLAERRKQNLPNIPLSVNMSRTNLSEPDLVSNLCVLVQKYGLSPAMLRLEITESAYMDNPSQLIDATKKLQTHGFKILMDDFGNGYSSLNMLKDIPANILKIDMQFLTTLETSSRAAALLLGIIRIAQQLEMVTIAEGVETNFQLNFLRTTGCDNIQGFYYAKPMPTEAFDHFLADPPMM